MSVKNENDKEIAVDEDIEEKTVLKQDFNALSAPEFVQLPKEESKEKVEMGFLKR